MPTKLLNRQRWDTRVQLANTIFENIEGFRSRQWRHSTFGWQTPIEFGTTAISRAPAPQNAAQITGS